MLLLLAIELNPVFTIGFLALGLPLIALELYGVARRPGGKAGGGDTISENWWALRNRYPGLTIPMAAFLIWLFYHFIFEQWHHRK